MPSDKHNLITAKAMGLIFSLLDITSSLDVPFGIPQYVQYILMDLPVASPSSLLRAKRVNLEAACDGFCY